MKHIHISTLVVRIQAKIIINYHIKIQIINILLKPVLFLNRWIFWNETIVNIKSIPFIKHNTNANFKNFIKEIVDIIFFPSIQKILQFDQFKFSDWKWEAVSAILENFFFKTELSYFI